MRSLDGTEISYTSAGDGPAVVLVGGGLDDGAENAALVPALSQDFTVINYARRGRGASGDTQPYAVQREIEDLAGLIALVGSASVFGASSGGALALEAAAAGLPIERIAVYEVPYMTDEPMAQGWAAYVSALDKAGPVEALELFMRLAGSSEEDIAGARASDLWPAAERLAHTLKYDAACIGDGWPPVAKLAAITQPVLVATGGRDAFFDDAADAVVAALPAGERLVLAAQGHVADTAVLGPVLTRFLSRSVDRDKRSDL